MEILKLYDFAESVCCQKIRLVIAEQGVKIEECPVPLDQGAQYDPLFLKINPKGIVPVAVHGDQIILESSVINEYIEETFDGLQLMPTDPAARARTRYWSLLVDQGIHNPHTTVVSFVIALRYAFLAELDTPEKMNAHLDSVRDPISREMQRQGFIDGYESAAFKIAIEAFDSLLIEMNGSLDESAWLAGDSPTLADFNLAPYIHRLDCLGLSFMWEHRKGIARWYSELKQRDSWNAAIKKPHIDKWLELMHMGGEEAVPKVKAILDRSST